jgi:hypothetical protein
MIGEDTGDGKGLVPAVMSCRVQIDDRAMVTCSYNL